MGSPPRSITSQSNEIQIIPVLLNGVGSAACFRFRGNSILHTQEVSFLDKPVVTAPSVINESTLVPCSICAGKHNGAVLFY
jgi:hypothetical protein